MPEARIGEDGGPADQLDAFRADVLAGLSAPIPAIPARWLYDRAGSELFDAITRLETYYPTRTETALLDAIMPEVRGADPARRGGRRVRRRLGDQDAAAAPRDRPGGLCPGRHFGRLSRTERGAAGRRFPRPPGAAGDRRLRPAVRACRPTIADLPRLGFFPGSTIGNFVPRSATDLLRHFRELLGTGSRLLIGMDRVKPVERLIAAYDDPGGVTARFNLNLATRINRELDGTIPLDAFRHEARWNDILSRIEMHWVALRDVEFSVAGRPFAFAAGSSIHTENSHKYEPPRRPPAAARRRLDAARRMERCGRRFRRRAGRGAAQPLGALSRV